MYDQTSKNDQVEASEEQLVEPSSAILEEDALPEADPVSEEPTESDVEMNSSLDANVDEENTDSDAKERFDIAMEEESAPDSLDEDDLAIIDGINETADEDRADPAAHDDVDLGAIEPEDDLDDAEKGDPYGGHRHFHLSKILEAALFASGATLSVSHLRDIFEPMERPHGRIVRQIMAELIASYEGKGVNLVEVASGYRFQTDVESAHWISRLWEEKPQRYSRALMETIALVAYRQPITRGEIEDVRGVAVSSNIIRTLLEREWVRVVGHRDVPGRPAMYATTRQFLDYFGLKSLDQLPSLSEIRDMDELNPQMELSSDDEKPNEDDKPQSEITFDAIANRFALQAEGKTGSEFIDEQLDDELAAMDEVNTNFEKALEQQRAEHEHPDLNLDSDDDEASENVDSAAESTPNENEHTDAMVGTDTGDNDVASDNSKKEASPLSPELSEEEQWKLIQEKLAQQQALLDARENDQSREDENNE